MHTLGHILGLDNASGPWYLLWSGIGGANLPWLLGIPLYLRHHNCEQRGCWRLGHVRSGHVHCPRHHEKASPE